MYHKLNACPLCEHPSFRNHLVVKDHSVSGESFALCECQNCKLVFTNPRPDNQNISRYYQHSNYLSHINKPQNLRQWVYQSVRFFTLRKKVNWINHSQPFKTNLLDYGCGTGAFLQVAKASGWNVWGVEPDDGARQASINKELVVVKDLQDIGIEKFDIITLWHVLEHIPNLRKTIKQLKRKLSSTGQLWIALPNRDSYDCQYYKQYWAGYDVPRHLYHFNQENIKFLSRKFRLKLIKTIPLKLDAYYVSMLSEKYHNGSLVNGIKQGYLSNNWAKANNGNYSSLVHVFQK